MLVVAAVLACGGPTPRERIVSALDAATAAAQAGDLDGLFRHVSDAYADERGRDKATLRAQVALQLRGYGRVYLFTRIGEPRFADAATAEVTLQVAAAGSEFAGLEALRTIDADLFELDLVMAREGRDWRVTSATRRPAALADFF